MKALKYLLSTVLLIAVVWGCSKEEFDNIDFIETGTAPANVAALFKITQDNTGLVSIMPTADGAVSFDIAYGDGTATSASIIAGKVATHTYSEGTYSVTVTANGITGLKTEISKEIVVSFQAPEFGSEPSISNDAAKSKQVNVTVPDDAKYAMFFDVYFVEDGVETIISANVGETASYTYANPGLVNIKVELKGGAIQTTLFSVTDFEVTEILQPVASAPTQPGRLATDYISVFSDSYADVDGNDFNPGWGQQTIYTAFDLNGDAMLQYSNLNYQGIQIGTPQDVTSMETLHIDVWSATANTIDFYPLPVGIASENEKYFTLDLLADQWNSFDIPLSYFTDQGLALDNIHQFKFQGSGSFFVDNIYFYKAPTVFADLPITLDSAVETFEPFLGAEFEITADPEDANNPVGKITNYGEESSYGWEGVSLKLDTWVDVSVIPTIKLDFYNDGGTHDVLIKLEDSTSPLVNNNPSVFEEVHVTVSNTGWSELVFNFTSGLSYDNIVLFVDGGVKGIPGTYYFDNVMEPAN
jgi:hypothetical protein